MKVLVLDDDTRLRHVLATVLARPEYEIEETASVTGALRSISQRPVDVLVLDTNLPSWGAELILRFVEESSPGTAVVLIGCDEGDLNAITSPVVVAKLPKPVEFRALRDAIRVCLDGGSRA